MDTNTKRRAFSRPLHRIFKGIGAGHQRRAGDDSLPMAGDTIMRYMQSEHLAGVLVLHRGRIRAERYGLGLTPSTCWTSFSVTKAVTDTLAKPNGLCFSPDYQKLYIVDTGVTHNPDHPREITVWDVVDGQRLRHSRTFASMMFEGMQGMSDGIRADIAGNIWSAAGWGGEGFDGVHIFAPNGDRIGQIMLPESCANLCFGGCKRNRVFMTSSQSLYAVYVETQGAHIA